MADKLVYKGGASVVGQTGTEMQLELPKRGGSVHRFPRWWNKKGSVAYIEVAIFSVDLANGEKVRLVVPHTDPGMTFEIRHDGAQGHVVLRRHQRTAVDQTGGAKAPGLIQTAARQPWNHPVPSTHWRRGRPCVDRAQPASHSRRQRVLQSAVR